MFNNDDIWIICLVLTNYLQNARNSKDCAKAWNAMKKTTYDVIREGNEKVKRERKPTILQGPILTLWTISNLYLT